MGLGPESGLAEPPAVACAAGTPPGPSSLSPASRALSTGLAKVTPRLPWTEGGGSEPAPRPAWESPQLAARPEGPHPGCGSVRAGGGAQPRARPAMAWERLPGRGCGALHRCLLGAALLLGLRLCTELRRAGAQPPARSGLPGPAPRPPEPPLPPAPAQRRGASRRQVTYVRSGRRAPPGGGGSGTQEPGCCPPRGRPRRKVSCKRYSLGP